MSVVVPTLQEKKNTITQDSIIINQIEFQKGDIVTVFGRDFHQNSVIINIIVYIFSLAIWYYLGLFGLMIDSPILLAIFLFQLFFVISQIFTTSTFSGNITLETTKLINAEQSNLMIFGSLIVLIFVTNQLIIEPILKVRLNIIIYSILLILTIISLQVNLIQNGENIKLIRYTKQAFINVCVFLLIVYFYLVISNLFSQKKN
jgi:hypothetical protein